ncbi:Major facilitator superfamily MFS_1 [Paraburkholderia piptadeniae]|uniref:Major facilitator superfamily MFS_1 n=1 Tax=Paraburkholderia piptadeniae TaxID=1701573 RepID=A0A1N7S015_9BURK|nr:oxalate/formate MFS antiporter [Paraburkholderia piptadeniae]SIT40705.1 Major facilitator superfamily MFS_1 [Paraburkholderia piptadeniae]
MSSAASPAGKPFLGNRWTQLFIGIACMALVANLQYAWTLFVVPMKTQNLWTAAEVQTAFSVFILVETWLVPIEGWLVDRFGPRPVVMAGAIFVALSWVIDSFATTLPVLYAASVIAGLGAGCVYGTCVGNALKWFPDRRGLAAGLTAAGFGAGAALTVIPIANMIHNSGYRQTFFVFGVIQGIAIFILSIALIRPDPGPGIKPVARVVTSKVDYTPGQMVRTPLFWMIYLLFVLVAAGGLIATAQLGPIAKAFGFAKLPVQFFGATLPLLTLALSIDNLLNGLTRPVCGLLSDKIGRENTMLLVFVGEGLALLGMNAYGHDHYAFLIFALLIFLCWGEIFSIFPAICADTFGSKYASSNAGTLYTAKGTASLLVPIASLVAAGGSWEHVLIGSAVVSVVAGVSAKFILAPMRKRWFAGMGDEVAPVLQTQ